jgi:DnaJ-class molecular chaperone
MSSITREKCATCYGEGVVGGGFRGPEECPDCHGLGRLASASVLTERRLRDLERQYAQQGGQLGQDVAWLVGEVRRAHHALSQVFTAAQDADEGDERAAKLRFVSNQVLGYYDVQDPRPAEDE